MKRLTSFIPANICFRTKEEKTHFWCMTPLFSSNYLQDKRVAQLCPGFRWDLSWKRFDVLLPLFSDIILYSDNHLSVQLSREFKWEHSIPLFYSNTFITIHVNHSPHYTVVLQLWVQYFHFLFTVSLWGSIFQVLSHRLIHTRQLLCFYFFDPSDFYFLHLLLKYFFRSIVL